MTQRRYPNRFGKVSEAVSKPDSAKNLINVVRRSAIAVVTVLQWRAYPSLRVSKVCFSNNSSLDSKRYIGELQSGLAMAKDSYVEGRAIPYSTEYVIPSRTATVLDSMTSGIAKLPHTVSCYVCANVAVWVTIKRAARLTLCQIDRVYGKVFDLSSRVLHYSNRVDAAFSHV